MNRKGFTLIELLIVVVIIGILAAIAIPKFANTKQKAVVASMKSDLRNLVTAQEAFFSDNNDYAGSVAATQTNGLAGAGAVAMIVPHRIDGVRVPQLIVTDTLIDGLWKLARAARARFNGPVIGLTGSAGKTSTKEFLAAYPNAYASPSSFNNFWGVPLTLCNASPGASSRTSPPSTCSWCQPWIVPVPAKRGCSV